MALRGPVLFLGIALGLIASAVASPAHRWRIFTSVDGLSETACVSLSIGANGNVIAAHSNAPFVSVFNGYAVTNYPAPPGRLGRIYESPSGQLWAMSPEGLLEYRETNWIVHRVVGLGTPVRETFIGLTPVRQGRVLILLRDRLIQWDVQAGHEVLQQAARLRIGGFRSIIPASDGSLWLSGERGVLKLVGSMRSLPRDGTVTEFIPPAELGLQNFATVQESQSGFTSFAETASGEKVIAEIIDGQWNVRALPGEARFAWRSGESLWLIRSNALLELRGEQTAPLEHPEISAPAIHDIAVEQDGAFWLATSDGLFRHAPAIWVERETTSAAPPRAPTRAVRRELAGLPEEVATRSDWKVTFRTRNSDLWLASDNEVGWRHRSVWEFYSSTNDMGPEAVFAFAEAPDGHVVCATTNKIWEFDGQNWLTMRSDFGRVNAIFYARDGTLWVAADSGVHRHARGAWMHNDTNDGLLTNRVAAVREEADGTIVAFTPEGECEFQPEADRDPPRSRILPWSDGDEAIQEGDPVTLEFDGRDKWDTTIPDRLIYSYRLDEREWSAFMETTEATFADLAVGKHYFQVRAMDRKGNIELQPVRLEFMVALPWYRETRLVWILGSALVVAIVLAGVAFNRHRRLQHSYADVERQVGERTRELEVANRELFHSQKMNAMGTLAAGIAHDFNNILSIVKGSAQIIEENLNQPEKIRTRLDRIRIVVQQGAGIVEAMLGFSRASDQVAASCDVNAVVDDTIKLLGDRFVREIEVQFDRDNSLPEISASRDFVQQVLLNFIFNAQEAMERQSPRTKRVTLATRPVMLLPTHLTLAPAKAKEYVAISVKDTGGGIAADVLPRIFEPFFTTKAMSARRGTGLGLSMVYELAKKMEAGLAVETVVGEGSTFTIYLPIKNVPMEQKSEPVMRT